MAGTPDACCPQVHEIPTPRDGWRLPTLAKDLAVPDHGSPLTVASPKLKQRNVFLPVR